VPLLVEWPDGRRAALLFVIEEETDPQRFCIHGLAHDCLDLAELFKIAVYAHAVRGLIELEPHPEKRLKYADFIDIYAALDENEQQLYSQRYPREAAEMTGFAERFIQQGIEKGIEQGHAQGIEQGMHRGEARMLTCLLQLRFGELSEAARQRIETADPETLLRWSERVLTAESLDEVLR
jgi:hypothetical protein